MEGVHFDEESENLNYTLWEAQERALKDFYDGESHITDFRAGYRAGKSILGARAIINGAWKLKNTRWLVMAETYKEGQRTTFDILFKNLPGYDGDDPESSPIVHSYHKQEGELKLNNGSVIVFAYSTKVDGVKGDEYSGVWMDEVAFYSDLYQVNDMVMSRLSARNGPLSIIWTTTTNPNNPFNDYYDISEEGVHPLTDDDIPWNINTVKANTLNNPFLTEEVKEQIQETQAHQEDQAINGGFATVDGQVYPHFTDNHIVDSDSQYYSELYSDFRLYAYDSGWDDPRVVLEVGMTTKGSLVVLDEFYEHESHVEDAIEWLQGKPGGVLVSESEPEHKSKFRQQVDNLRVVKANKSIDEGIESVSERLKEKSGVYGLVVMEEAVNTIEEFRTYTKDVIGTAQASDHCMDCIRYLVHTKTPSPDTQKPLMDDDSGSEGGDDGLMSGFDTVSGGSSGSRVQERVRKRDKQRNRGSRRR